MALIMFIVYLIGIPFTFWLLDGFEDFKPDPPDEDGEYSPRDYSANADRYLSILIALLMSFVWPIFWVFCIGLAIISKLFGLS